MAKKKSRSHGPNNRVITEVWTRGFKSILDEQHIEIRPLTILAGANSSGKSSMMQPILLLKQTLESAYDPGPLLLSGPNVKFSSAEQLLSQIGQQLPSDGFAIGVRFNTNEWFETTFRKEHRAGFRIEEMRVKERNEELTLWPDMTIADINRSGITSSRAQLNEIPNGQWRITRDRCMLELSRTAESGGASQSISEKVGAFLHAAVPDVIHLSGLRGNPERAYPVSATGPSFPGTFGSYTASLLSLWTHQDGQAIERLNEELMLLELSGGVAASEVNAVQVEIHVGRLPTVPPKRREDRINIADVGIGLSQVLPVLVAMHAAGPQHLVYIEQPEIHLHPRAQFELGQVIARAVNRGVRLVIETHSSLLLLGVQAQVAIGQLAAKAIKLHWFRRDEDGRTRVKSADMDEAGRFGDWPEDFDDVTLQAQKKYLDAAEERLAAT